MILKKVCIYFLFLFLYLCGFSQEFTAPEETVEISDFLLQEGNSAKESPQKEGLQEENLDDLFETPPDDIVAEDSKTDYKNEIDQNRGILFKGNFSASGGIAVGWSKFPSTCAEFRDTFGVSPVAAAAAHLFMDARPIPEIKLHADIYTDIDKNAIGSGWAGPMIEELYGEYDLRGFTYFRIGQFSSKWGNGRIFTPGNLMLNSQRGLSIGITFPTLLDGIKYVCIADKAVIPVNSGRKDITPSELIHAALFDKAFGSTRLTLGVRYQVYEGIKGLFSVKTILWGTEFFGDIIIQNPDFVSYDKLAFKALAGVYREWDKIRFYAEYFYDGASKLPNDHNIGVALHFKNIFNSIFDFKILAEHTFSDNSGNVIPLFSFSPWKNISVNFGVPVIWGPQGSRYLVPKNSANYNRSDIINDIPRDKQLSFLIAVKFSTDF